jgi:AmmeMemoRadiSam system protein A
MWDGAKWNAEMPTEPLNAEDRATLLLIARRALMHRAMTGGRPHRFDLGVEPIPPRLDARQGAFVTLRQDGDLRGCIGHLQALDPLWRNVAESAVSAAWGDTRFDPTPSSEVSSLEIEITVLGPLEPIQGPEEITVGKHGLLIESAEGRGVLLPQVAEEHGWDAERFLDETCHKANLPRDAWRRADTEICRFNAEHFAERRDDTA